MCARHFVKSAIIVLALSPAAVHAQVPTPDLQPTGLSVDRDCRIVVSIRNNGPGPVPDAGYSLTYPDSSGVQMWIGSSPWGGIVLGALDPGKLTQPAGGTISYTWFSSLPLPPGTHGVAVEVDNNNAIVEADETNNSLSAMLTCEPQLPDLEPIDLALDSSCRIDVTFRNNGPAEVPDSAYADAGGGNLQMYVDGAPFGGLVLGVADPAPHQSQPVGGTKVHKWFSSLPLPFGTHTVKLQMDTFDNIAESNEMNNTIEKVLTCRKPLPDLVPVDITVHPTTRAINSPCRVMLTLKNIGTAPVPDAAYAYAATAPVLQMWRNGHGFGGTILVGFDPAKGVQPVGATHTSSWMFPTASMLLPPGDHVLTIEVDKNNALEELNETNNSLTRRVRCGTRILPPLP